MTFICKEFQKEGGAIIRRGAIFRENTVFGNMDILESMGIESQFYKTVGDKILNVLVTKLQGLIQVQKA